MKFSLPELPDGARISSFTIACTGVDSFRATLETFGVGDERFYGALENRIVRVDLGVVEVLIELAELSVGGSRPTKWLYRS